MPKHIFIRRLQWIFFAACVLALGQMDVARAENFEVYSGKSGCESIVVERARRSCMEVQKKKNEACNVKMTCDLKAHEDQIEAHKAAKDKLKTINDSDRGRLEDTIRDLKTKLDARKAQAAEGIKIASACITARDAVQDWFTNVGIAVTKSARTEALMLRTKLLAKLEDAQKKREEAKKNRDAKPDDSKLKSEWEKAAATVREVEKELERFNATYGRDIERHADRLIQKYIDGKKAHDEPFQQAQNRLEKCKAVVAMSY